MFRHPTPPPHREASKVERALELFSNQNKTHIDEKRLAFLLRSMTEAEKEQYKAALNPAPARICGGGCSF